MIKITSGLCSLFLTEDSAANKHKLRKGNIIILLTVLFLGSIFLIYSLSSTPFGTLFRISVYLNLFLGLALHGFLGLSLLGLSRRWKKYLGGVVLAYSILILFLVVIVTIDYRILYFKKLPSSPSIEEWREDLRYLENKMTEIHPNLFQELSAEQFSQAVDNAEKRLEQLDDPSVFIEFIKILALAGDSHTAFLNNFFFCQKHHAFPITIGGFSDGWYVMDAGRGNRDLIGTKLLSIGCKDIEEIYISSKEIWGSENEYGTLGRFPMLAMWAEWLKSESVINKTNKASFSFQRDDGEMLDRSLSSVSFISWAYWAFMSKVTSGNPPQLINMRKDAFRFDRLDKNRTIYIQHNEDLKYSNGESIDAFSARLLDSISDSEVDRIIVDLRNNIGGDEQYVFPLLNALKSSGLVYQNGKLYVLIGRLTFSAGVSFAELLKNTTNAVFVGEPTSQGARYYSIPRTIELPNSKIKLRISSELSGYTINPEPGNKISPDIWLKYKFDDIAHDLDSAIDTIMQLEYSDQTNIVELPDENLDIYCGRYLYNPITMFVISKKNNRLYYQLTDFSKYNVNLREGYLYPIEGDVFADFRNECFVKQNSFEDHWQKQIIVNLHSQLDTLAEVHDTFKLPMEYFREGNYKEGAEMLISMKDDYLKFDSDIKGYLNIVGYELLTQDNIKGAIEVFKANVELFPDSPNNYDSLAEAYMKDGQIDLAVKNYQKCLALDAGQLNAKK